MRTNMYLRVYRDEHELEHDVFRAYLNILLSGIGTINLHAVLWLALPSYTYVQSAQCTQTFMHGIICKPSARKELAKWIEITMPASIAPVKKKKRIHTTYYDDRAYCGDGNCLAKRSRFTQFSIISFLDVHKNGSATEITDDNNDNNEKKIITENIMCT